MDVGSGNNKVEPYDAVTRGAHRGALAGLAASLLIVLMVGLGKLDLFVGISVAVLLSSLCVFMGAMLGGLHKKDSRLVHQRGS